MFIMLLIDVYGGKLSNLLHSERRGNSIMRTSVEFIEQGKRGASLPRSMKLIFSITSFIFKLYMKRSLLTLFDPIPYNCHFFYTDTIFVRIKFTPKNADFSR